MNLNPEQQRERLLAIQRLLSDEPNTFVLIVDDDGDDAGLAENILSGNEIKVDVARGYGEAMQKIEGCPYHLVFLDWKLTGRSGLDTLKSIKSKCPKCFVIILTGKATDNDSATALEHGAAAVMRKPLTNEDVRFIFGAFGQ